MGIDTSGGHPSMEYSQHKETYGRFLSYTKVAIIFLICLLAGMFYFLV
jgi:Bacterial aa3 type cytochrome c oxidase subunit IV